MLGKLIAGIALVLTLVSGGADRPATEGTREVPVTVRME